MLAKRTPRDMLRVLDNVGRTEDVFSSIVDDFFHFHGFSPFRGLSNPDFSPSLDFKDKEKEYLVNLEVPGIEKDGIEIEIDDGLLIIKGEKKAEKIEKDEEIYASERCYGAFRREIRLPSDCQEEKIKADYKNGVLSITLPKNEVKEKEKKKINIEGE